MIKRKRKPQRERPPAVGEIDQVIGARLRTYRRNAKLSQAELGEHLGVTFQQVQKYENGSNRLSGSRMIAACDLLKITTAQLLGNGSSNPAPDVMESLHDPDITRILMAIGQLPEKQRRAVARSIREMVRAFGGKI